MPAVYLVAWVPMAFIAVLNGLVRDKVYGPHMSKLAAHQLSCVIGVLLFTGYTIGLELLYPLPGAVEAVRAGLAWLGMTLIFEFWLVVWVLRLPPRAALDDWNLRRGRLWPLVLVAVTGLPWAVFRLLGAQ